MPLIGNQSAVVLPAAPPVGSPRKRLAAQSRHSRDSRSVRRLRLASSDQSPGSCWKDQSTTNGVWRVMRQAGLLCRRKRRTVHTTDSNHSYQIYPNLVKGLQVEALNRGSGRRSDVCTVPGRRGLPGLPSGRLFAHMHRLEPISMHRCAAATAGITDGHSSTRDPSRAHPSLRPGKTVL